MEALWRLQESTLPAFEKTRSSSPEPSRISQRLASRGGPSGLCTDSATMSLTCTVAMTKYLTRSNLQKEGFLWVCSLKGCIPWRKGKHSGITFLSGGSGALHALTSCPIVNTQSAHSLGQSFPVTVHAKATKSQRSLLRPTKPPFALPTLSPTAPLIPLKPRKG